MSRLERIVAACGGILLDGGTRALIPGPDHTHQDRSVSLVETEEGRIIIHCFSPRDDWRAVRAQLLERGLLSDTVGSVENKSQREKSVVIQPRNEDRVARAARIWNEGVAIGSTPAFAYLRRRNVEAGAASTALRYHARMTSIDDRLRRPALLASIVDATGKMQGLQATLLTKHGAAKAAVATPRRVIGRLLGGAVRLREAEAELAIGEGVETMISASAALGLPAWAALSAHNLSLFEPPPSLKRLVVAIDNDPAGRKAGETLKMRLGIDVEIVAPPTGVNDWNDARPAPEEGA